MAFQFSTLQNPRNSISIAVPLNRGLAELHSYTWFPSRSYPHVAFTVGLFHDVALHSLRTTRDWKPQLACKYPIDSKLGAIVVHSAQKSLFSMFTSVVISVLTGNRKLGCCVTMHDVRDKRHAASPQNVYDTCQVPKTTLHRSDRATRLGSQIFSGADACISRCRNPGCWRTTRIANSCRSPCSTSGASTRNCSSLQLDCSNIYGPYYRFIADHEWSDASAWHRRPISGTKA